MGNKFDADVIEFPRLARRPAPRPVQQTTAPSPVDPIFEPCLSLGCLSPSEVERARRAGMRSDPAARALLDDYLREMTAENMPCICGRIRADLMLAQARADEEHATLLARALLIYLTEHPPHCA
ncbi:MAG: hypothetical protein AAF899_04320 [Pseudomonadota bacterium]